MNRQSKNAQRIAERLAGHPGVRGCTIRRCSRSPNSSGSGRAVRFSGLGLLDRGRGGKRGAFEFLRRLKIAKNAVSLGGIETLACHPKTTTHSELLDEELADAGITDGLVRISIGTEHWKDLVADFESALA